jgi:hypothetical protein
MLKAEEVRVGVRAAGVGPWDALVRKGTKGAQNNANIFIIAIP